LPPKSVSSCHSSSFVRNEQERGKQEEPFLSGRKVAKDGETQFGIAESENRSFFLLSYSPNICSTTPNCK
jgi:hypothetical protein